VSLRRERVSRRFDTDQSQVAFEGADNHHLAGDEVEGHAEEGGITRLETEEVVGAPGRGEHTGLLNEHGLGSTSRAASLHVDIR
jgi:hypothetical protein